MNKIILLNLLLVLVFSCPAEAGTITVKADGTGDYPTIQAAIDAAVNGDTVIVADGVYTGTGNRDIDFKGKAITVRSENGPVNCIIDCNNAGRGFYFHAREGADSVLKGLTITNGFITEGSGGAGIFCGRSEPTITNCIIRENINALTNPIYKGGGIYCEASSPKITNCMIIANEGSGILLNDSSPEIKNCIISNNTAVYDGGIRFVDVSYPTIANCTISDNSAEGYGGGVCGMGSNSSVGNPFFINCIFWGNTAPNGAEIALLAAANPSSATFSYCDVQGGESEAYVQQGHQPCTLNWGAGNINIYSEFFSSADYHLRVDSACINAGDPNGYYNG